jgi:flavin-dependent dehydrogenase
LLLSLFRHDYLLNEDEMLKAALGDNYKIEQMRAGVLRLGGVPVSYAEHLLVTGDAAGMIDPMTGEGIHHAMDGGRMAAQTLLECIKQGNYSREAMNVYQQRWMYAFGSDFKWSDNICLVSAKKKTQTNQNQHARSRHSESGCTRGEQQFAKQ